MRFLKTAIIVVVSGCVIAVTAVSFHSVWEIHYLKTFYPDSFSVTEAAQAAGVELIKVALTSFPLLLIILLCVWAAAALRKKKGQ